MIKRLKALMKRKGYASILMIFMVAFTTPFFIFYFVEINHLYSMKDKYQAFADSAASGAVMQLEREQIHNGKLILDEEEAKLIANELIANNYNLTGDMEVTADSVVTESPTVKVYTVGFDEEVDDPPVVFVTDEGFTYNITNPTVIVYTVSKPKGIFYSHFVEIQTISAYEVSFKTGSDAQISSVPQVTPDGLQLKMNRIVNPLSFSGETSVFPLDWDFDSLPMAAGGNIEFSVSSTNADVVISGASYNLRIEAEGYNHVESRVMTRVSDYEANDVITLPEDAPIGAVVTVDFGEDGILVDKTTGTESKGNSEFGFSEVGETVGNIETNVFKLVRIQKKYQE